MDKWFTLLRRLNLTVSTIESFTGGLLADAFIAQPGASEIFHQGHILYQTKSKASWLGITEATLSTIDGVSESLIALLLKRGHALGLAKLILATTGNAGPTSQGKTSVGTAFLGISDGTHTLIKGYQFKGTRQAIRQAGVQASLDLLESFLSTYYQTELQ